MSRAGPGHHPVLATAYDLAMVPAEWVLGLGRERQRTMRPARGRVLEVGAGTGLNRRHYGDISELLEAEPDPHMRARARRRLVAHHPPFPVSIVAAAAERLPFPDRSFDTVVACLVLCTVQGPQRALSEIRRVLRADGTLLLLEHMRSGRPAIAWLQHAMTPAWRSIAGGCHLDRPTVDTVEGAGFTFTELARRGGGRASAFRGCARPSPGTASG